MTIWGMETSGIHVWAGDEGYSYSRDIFFAPTYTVAQVGFSEVDGNGLHRAGISRYWYRDGSNVDHEVDLGKWPSWYHTLYMDNCSGITFSVAVGGSQEVRAHCNLFFWE